MWVSGEDVFKKRDSLGLAYISACLVPYPEHILSPVRVMLSQPQIVTLDLGHEPGLSVVIVFPPQDPHMRGYQNPITIMNTFNESLHCVATRSLELIYFRVTMPMSQQLYAITKHIIRQI